LFRDVFWLVIDSKNSANDLPHVMAATRIERRVRNPLRIESFHYLRDNPSRDKSEPSFVVLGDD